MDFFSHLLWTLLAFRGESPMWLWMVVGTLPDLVTWGPWVVHSVATHRWTKFDVNAIPGYTLRLYDATHSILVAGTAWGAWFILTGQWFTPPLAWLLHLSMDVPTHSRDFLPTPFLWPVSEWKFPGFRWAQRGFMALNYSALVGLAVFFFAIQGHRLRWG